MVIKRVMAAALVALAMGAGACTAEVEEKGEAPSVDVDGGKMPQVDGEPAKVEVSTDTQQVVTPEVNVTPTEGDDK